MTQVWLTSNDFVADWVSSLHRIKIDFEGSLTTRAPMHLLWKW